MLCYVYGLIVLLQTFMHHSPASHSHLPFLSLPSLSPLSPLFLCPLSLSPPSLFFLSILSPSLFPSSPSQEVKSEVVEVVEDLPEDADLIYEESTMIEYSVCGIGACGMCCIGVCGMGAS